MLRKVSVLILAISFACLAQAPSAHPRPQPNDEGQQGWPNNKPPDPGVIDMRKHAERELGKQRYKDIKSDSERLLALATQLKQQVDTAGEHTLSLDVIKKAEQIEKLAKDVKNKMKG